MAILTGNRVRIRSLDSSDLREFHQWWNDPEFSGDYASFVPMSFSEVEKLARESNSFIVETNNKKKIGFVAYYNVRTDYPYLYEIGYRTLSSERRKGYTTEAVGLLVDYLFSTMDIERLESVTDAGNIPSQRVLEKNGFEREGILRKRSRNKSEYRDEYMYSLLREERT
jgi:[ribosomal protein S5]-alanine N-acetyltransferase